MFVPQGFRDEDGVWHHGPHYAEAMAALDVLVGYAKRAEELEASLDACALEQNRLVALLLKSQQALEARSG